MSNILNTFFINGRIYLAINIWAVMKAGLVVGITGLIIGILLGIAGIILKIKTDEKFLTIRSLLPGANCGACGYAGCDNLALALVEGNTEISACPVASEEAYEQIWEALGKENEKKVKKVALVKCIGTCDKTVKKYIYWGSLDCKRAIVVPGKGDKACGYGCMGYGTCVKVCMFDAIKIVDGCAVVDRDKCTACGKCVADCPKNVIELVPHDAGHFVECSSKASGRVVRSVCKVGCIGCKICVKQCEFDAIMIEENLARIDYEKCTNCGKCVEKCPQKVIA